MNEENEDKLLEILKQLTDVMATIGSSVDLLAHTVKILDKRIDRLEGKK